jgi:hypothetical protein
MIVGFTVASRLKSRITIRPGWKRYQGGAASERRSQVGG